MECELPEPLLQSSHAQVAVDGAELELLAGDWYLLLEAAVLGACLAGDALYLLLTDEAVVNLKPELLSLKGRAPDGELILAGCLGDELLVGNTLDVELLVGNVLENGFFGEGMDLDDEPLEFVEV